MRSWTPGPARVVSYLRELLTDWGALPAADRQFRDYHRHRHRHPVPLRPRAAAYIMLLYAQPLTRGLRLTASDLTGDDGRTWLDLGYPATSGPPPFDELLHQLTATRLDHVPQPRQHLAVSRPPGGAAR